MMFYALQIYAICVLFFSGFENYVQSQQEGSLVETSFPKQQCESLLVNCSCYDLEPLLTNTAGIVCKNLNNFSNFSLLLGSIFGPNKMYEVEFSGVRHVPANVLEGMVVYRLILDDTEITLDENAFEGVLYLKRFHARRSGIKEVPDFGAVNKTIKKISIESSQLSSLQGKGLQNLPLVQRLAFVNNFIRFLDPEIFKGTDNITILDLSNNLLTSLPPKLLDPMKNLLKFAVRYNNLLHVDNLFSVTHPRFILLDFNNITNIDTVLHSNMDIVETFVIASNPIEKISANSFSGKIPNVRFLYLDHCRIREFNEMHYRTLTNLATLDLGYNLIEGVSNQKIEFGKNMDLNLVANEITKFDAEITYTVKRLYLNENKLKRLDTTLQLTQIVEVQIARNLISYLTEEDFKGVHATSNLELQENQIQRIDEFTFLAIRNDLHYLDLSSNLLKCLNGSVKFLSQLKLLNLTGNRIQTFESGEFTGLNELSELYLQNNRIVALGQLQQLPRLQYLVIKHNKIDTFSPDHIPKTLRFMYLAGNPITCSCRLQPFLLWLNTSGSPMTDIDICLPPDAKSEILERRYKCPGMCSCGCEADGNAYFISVDCSSKNLTDVPPLLRSDLVYVEDNTTIAYNTQRSLFMEQNIYSSFYIRDRVLGINLENNSLESLESAHIPSNLIQLYISDNKLRRLPEYVFYQMQRLKRVTLSGNPWLCDCGALAFHKWLFLKETIVQDINNTLCGPSSDGHSELSGRAMWSLTDRDICPTDVGMIASTAFGVLVLLSVCLATKILYTKYELNIKVFLYSHGFTCTKEKDLDYDKQYDAFLSFSHKDEVFVTKEIISVIEKKHPNVRLCIHYRHFRPGEFIHDNIIYAVQNSKRTVLILSRNFLESEWCLMEFRAAHIQALEDKVHRIIVVKVGELPQEIDPSIKVYLDSTTYLTWGDKYFWNNLLYVLPTSGVERNPPPRQVEKNRIV